VIGGGDLAIAAIAALAAGAVNALAGGGTLITFPALIALGIPPIVANVTNTVALCPGYLGGTLAQRGDLRGQAQRLYILLPAGLVGGVGGGILLLHTGEKLFRDLVPFLILLASVLLGIQDPVRAFLRRRAQAGASASAPAPVASATGLATPDTGTPAANAGFKTMAGAGASADAGHRADGSLVAFAPVALAAVYGGYFGAGLSVIILAALALVLDDSLTRLNALKQGIAFAANVGAAVVFVLSGRVAWPVAAVMAVAALLGGSLGGRLAGRVRASTLRWIVVGLGVVVAVIYFVR
jgi:uncharacterized protein